MNNLNNYFDDPKKHTRSICFFTSWGNGLNHNRTFSLKYALKMQALYAAKPVKTAKFLVL